MFFGDGCSSTRKHMNELNSKLFIYKKCRTLFHNSLSSIIFTELYNPEKNKIYSVSEKFKTDPICTCKNLAPVVQLKKFLYKKKLT